MGDNSLPYLVAPGSLKTCLERIRDAATPDKVTGDFVSTVLNIKGGTGRALVPFLKKLGMVAADGTPTDLYRRFRNPASAGPAIAEAIKNAYKALRDVNESFYLLKDQELKDLVVQVTGVSSDSKVGRLVFSTLKTLKQFATFASSAETTQPQAAPPPTVETALVHQERNSGDYQRELPRNGDIAMNLSYTINLNLPATTDQSVFNAIFRSLKEHLLSNAD